MPSASIHPNRSVSNYPIAFFYVVLSRDSPSNRLGDDSQLLTEPNLGRFRRQSRMPYHEVLKAFDLWRRFHRADVRHRSDCLGQFAWDRHHQIRCRSQPPEVFPGFAPGQKVGLAPEPPAEAEDSPVLAKAILLGRCVRRCGLSESGARLRRCLVISRENGSLPAGSKNNALLQGLHDVLPRVRRGWTKDSGRPVANAHHAYYLF